MSGIKETKPKIIFILNTFGLTGGVKVIFEHANQLAAKGYEVNLIHLLRLRSGMKNYLISFLKWFKYHLPFINNHFYSPHWFSLRPEIKLSHQLSLKEAPADALVIATANETADAVNDLPIEAARKFYFVQDYESWTRSPEEVDRTYSYDLKKIVISRRLGQLLKDKFNQARFGPVSNGISDIFLQPSSLPASQKTTPPRGRILLLYNPAPHKGFKEGLAAYEIIKKSWPTAELIVFGAYHLTPSLASADLVKEFYFQPAPEKIRELYSSCDIFIYAALQEGFALTPLEAMASGGVVVSSDVGAVSDYGQNGKNIIIVPPADSAALAQAVLKLLNNQPERDALAAAAQQAASEHTWQKASDQLEKILLADS
jgi:glycosyltransferase involved in cell wall biosynthesis